MTPKYLQCTRVRIKLCYDEISGFQSESHIGTISSTVTVKT